MSYTVYNITIVNNFNQTTQYLLFCDFLATSANIGPAYTKVYTVSPGAGVNGSTVFSITSESFAVCDNSSSSFRVGVNVPTCDYQEIALDPNSNGFYKVDIQDGELVFGGTPTTTSADGGYVIESGGFSSNEHSEFPVRLLSNQSAFSLLLLGVSSLCREQALLSASPETF
ncbi:hypothetical protein G7Y89_g14280 [Cudoniella acicularis]|uniref:Uncharacterized protein n=1 Tax=Cudoniella acicularis TaxID=354080 RepID=A0A8H4R6R7_9HELO|nr:hypothetical protein G7Y89_g14280 [Cudoniella acicularis]